MTPMLPVADSWYEIHDIGGVSHILETHVVA